MMNQSESIFPLLVQSLCSLAIVCMAHFQNWLTVWLITFWFVYEFLCASTQNVSVDCIKIKLMIEYRAPHVTTICCGCSVFIVHSLVTPSHAISQCESMPGARTLTQVFCNTDCNCIFLSIFSLLDFGISSKWPSRGKLNTSTLTKNQQKTNLRMSRDLVR